MEKFSTVTDTAIACGHSAEQPENWDDGTCFAGVGVQMFGLKAPCHVGQ